VKESQKAFSGARQTERTKRTGKRVANGSELITMSAMSAIFL
jgi:hypothetical protein